MQLPQQLRGGDSGTTVLAAPQQFVGIVQEELLELSIKCVVQREGGTEITAQRTVAVQDPQLIRAKVAHDFFKRSSRIGRSENERLHVQLPGSRRFRWLNRCQLGGSLSQLMIVDDSGLLGLPPRQALQRANSVIRSIRGEFRCVNFGSEIITSWRWSSR